MILADNYYRDTHSGKGVIAGTFNSIRASKFPTRLNFAVFIALTDVATSGTVTLEIRNEQTPRKIELPPWNIQAPQDRQAIIEIGGNLRAIPFESPGTYEVAVLWNAMEISSRRLTLTPLSQEKK
ncbi:hypothetical protein CALK_1596 [Chitinivibrio alkaliphilus ACht1]|uniref:Uncharacterized protein n=2 Tax=Chitinivibrio TaxID=1505231 RepID=U7D7J5_9BACT|nr:hypothetical protein CALK_1596 [Chitinivibrio alkaliphilus ACht1]